MNDKIVKHFSLNSPAWGDDQNDGIPDQNFWENPSLWRRRDKRAEWTPDDHGGHWGPKSAEEEADGLDSDHHNHCY